MNRLINYAILTITLSFGLLSYVNAYESVEEIDAIKVEDNLQELVQKADKTCRSSFKDGEAQIYDNLDMVSYKRKNCGDKLIDSLQDCDDVDYACVKPKLKDLDDALAAHKVKLKDELAKSNAKKAKKAEKQALKTKQKDQDLSLEEINKILRD